MFKSTITSLLTLTLINFYSEARADSLLTPKTDICIYGGTSAGVIAAYTAAKLHKNVILIEPGNRLGGLSSGGLGFTDIGNKYVVTGIARDFYRRVGRNYGNFEQWTFEPHVAEAIFLSYVREGAVKVLYHSRLKKVNKSGTAIRDIEIEDALDPKKLPIDIVAKEYIDCTYEGDLMAKAGVNYTTGREANEQYHETVNGVQLRDKHQFPDNIDPYIIPGKPASGLVWGVSAEKIAPVGSGDKKIQSYNFRICLTNEPSNRIPITRPALYDSTHYELLLRYVAVNQTKDIKTFLKIDLMPNHKTDINNNGPFSTDMIGMNYDYPDGDYTKRENIIAAHKEYTQGLLYFIGHDLRVPEQLRLQMLEWGYPKDEYVSSEHFTTQMYVREARRMIGAYVMTQSNCQGKEVVPDGVGMGAYNMDSHNAERIVINGMVKNEGDVQLKGINPYPIAYRAITPKPSECSNLLVPVCLSASHMAYGSIRMEPVFMVLGQSAATAACLAIDTKKAVQFIDIKQLQTQLKVNPLADGGIPEILVDNDDTEGVSKTGTWERKSNGGYGPSYLTTDPFEKAEVKFSPKIVNGGRYQIYIYLPKLPEGSSSIKVSLFDGYHLTNKNVDKKEINVNGQTSGEWVYIGTRQLNPGVNVYVGISNSNADGVVVADAVLFLPMKPTN